MWDPVPISFHPLPGHGEGKSRHVVAIRYSSFFWDSPILSGRRQTFGWYIGDLQQMIADRANMTRKGTFHQMFLVGVLLAFALLHFLLFLFYPQQRTNLYFAALAVCLALTVYFQVQGWFITDAMSYMLHEPSVLSKISKFSAEPPRKIGVFLNDLRCSETRPPLAKWPV
jgi:hypothetical protein